jgi:ABC-type sulfate transport system permease component
VFYSNDGGIDYMARPDLIIILIFVDMILMARAKRAIAFRVFFSLVLLTFIGTVYAYSFTMGNVPHEKFINFMLAVFKIFPWIVWSFFVYGVYSNLINYFNRYKS